MRERARARSAPEKWNELTDDKKEEVYGKMSEIHTMVHARVFQDQKIGCVDIEKAEETYRALVRLSAFLGGVTLLVYFVLFMTAGGGPVVLAMVIPAVVILVMSAVVVTFAGNNECHGLMGLIGFFVVIVLMVVLCTVSVFAGTLASICAPIVIVFTIACSAFSIALLGSASELAQLRKSEENMFNAALHVNLEELFPLGTMAPLSRYNVSEIILPPPADKRQAPGAGARGV